MKIDVKFAMAASMLTMDDPSMGKNFSSFIRISEVAQSVKCVGWGGAFCAVWQFRSNMIGVWSEDNSVGWFSSVYRRPPVFIMATSNMSGMLVRQWG